MNTALTKDNVGGSYVFAIGLFEYVVVPTFAVDLDGNVVIWNRACERLTGVSAQEVLGTNNHWRAFYEEPRFCLADIIIRDGAKDLDTLYPWHAGASENGIGLRAENWCVMPRANKRLYLAIDAGPIYDNEGVMIAAVETLRDITELKTAQTTLEAAHQKASRALTQVNTLLNNSGQGFFSFAEDMVVADGYSAACVSMLGIEPAGKQADELLFPDDERTRRLMRECVSDAINERRKTQREVYLSLIPADLERLGKMLSARFVPLDGEVMVILSDVTDERILAEQLERESRRMEMIVSAVSDTFDFFGTVEQFRDFISDGKQGVFGTDWLTLYREIHTYKGSFGQLGFHYLPRALHDAEAALSEAIESPTNVKAAASIFDQDWISLLDQDLLTLNKALGNQFLERGAVITLTPDTAKRFEAFATTCLNGTATPSDHKQVLDELASIRMISLQKELEAFDKLIQQVALRLDKSVKPLIVEGPDVLIDPYTFGPFVRNLGHLFRNAVDHGIEGEDHRFDAGKDEAGQISCRIAITDHTFTLEISDDGGGIDEQKLRQRAAGKLAFDTATCPIEDLIFADGISSRDTVTTISGRGVGLASVRSSASRLGGRVHIIHKRGEGTAFRFTFPFSSMVRKSND